MLLGAHAEGVRKVLAVTGDPPEGGDYPGSRGVYEVDAIGLDEIDGPAERGHRLPRARRSTRRRRSFPAWPSTRPPTTSSRSCERFARKIEAGARFAMTQMVFDLAVLERMLERIGGDEPDPAARRRCGRFARHELAVQRPQRDAGDRRARARTGAVQRGGAERREVGAELVREPWRARASSQRACTSSRRSGARSACSICC